MAIQRRFVSLHGIRLADAVWLLGVLDEMYDEHSILRERIGRLLLKLRNVTGLAAPPTGGGQQGGGQEGA